jgi:CubicO group peptidase (beta-lactamase class C family)
LPKHLSTLRKPEDVLTDYTKRLAALPLNFHPGHRWEYGLGVDVLGRLVEVVSGQSLDEFFRRRILEPLGMRDTFFYLPGDRIARLVSAYKPRGGGAAGLEKLTALGSESRTGRLFLGGGGLAGTAEDYMRFCQMLIGGGQLDGTRLVSRKTIEAMTANQIGPLTISTPNYGFGLGFRVRREVGQSATLGSVGEYGRGGAYGTVFWVDPAEKMVGILMIQLLPNEHLNLRREFQNAVTQAIVD